MKKQDIVKPLKPLPQRQPLVVQSKLVSQAASSSSSSSSSSLSASSKKVLSDSSLLASKELLLNKLLEVHVTLTREQTTMQNVKTTATIESILGELGRLMLTDPSVIPVVGDIEKRDDMEIDGDEKNEDENDDHVLNVGPMSPDPSFYRIVKKKLDLYTTLPGGKKTLLMNWIKHLPSILAKSIGSKSNIIGGAEKSGIWPLDMMKIFQNCSQWKLFSPEIQNHIIDQVGPALKLYMESHTLTEEEMSDLGIPDGSAEILKERTLLDKYEKDRLKNAVRGTEINYEARPLSWQRAQVLNNFETLEKVWAAEETKRLTAELKFIQAKQKTTEKAAQAAQKAEEKIKAKIVRDQKAMEKKEKNAKAIAEKERVSEEKANLVSEIENSRRLALAASAKMKKGKKLPDGVVDEKCWCGSQGCNVWWSQLNRFNVEGTWRTCKFCSLSWCHVCGNAAQMKEHEQKCQSNCSDQSSDDEGEEEDEEEGVSDASASDENTAGSSDEDEEKNEEKNGKNKKKERKKNEEEQEEEEDEEEEEEEEEQVDEEEQQQQEQEQEGEDEDKEEDRNNERQLRKRKKT